MFISRQEQTPIDERTKLPLPILPYERAESISWHHHSHPSNSPLLKEAGGLAIRTVRLQLAEGEGGRATTNPRGNIKRKYGQHQRYHYFYDGPPLPETPKEQFEYVVWAASGYIPEYALEVRGRMPKTVRMNPDQIRRLQENEIKVGSNQILTDFLKDYIFEQDISHVENNIIDEFISKDTNWARKKFLGHWLLAQASEVATESIAQPYREAHKLGLVSLRNTTKISNVVKAGIIRSKRQQQGLIQQLEQKLAA